VLLCWLPKLLSPAAPLLLLLPAVEVQEVSTAQLPAAMLSTSIQQGLTAAASMFTLVLPLLLEPAATCCAAVLLLECWVRSATKAAGCGRELAKRKVTKLPLLL
jgi:hypothetical protein